MRTKEEIESELENVLRVVESNKPKERAEDYSQKVINIAYSYFTIVPCWHCGNPVVKGYCCDYCHSSEPRGGDKKETLEKAIKRKYELTEELEEIEKFNSELNLGAGI